MGPNVKADGRLGRTGAVNLRYSASMQGSNPESPLRAAVTWLIVLVGVVVMINLDGWLSEAAPPEPSAAAGARVATTTEMVGKLSLGAFGLMPSGSQEMKGLLGSVQDGSFIGDAAAAAMALRMGEQADARRLLDEAEHRSSPAPDDLELVRALRVAIDAGSREPPREGERSSGLSESEQTTLRDRLGWFGEQVIWAAENPGSSDVPRELTLRAMGLVGFGLAGILGGIIGLGWLIALLILAYTGRVQSALRPPPRASALLLELFAAWIVIHIAVAVGASLLVPRDERLGGGFSLLLTLLAATLPITGLVWVRLRRENWGEIRRELGINAPASWPREIGIGFLTWLSGIPLLGIGLLLSFILGALLGTSPSEASHPVQEAIAEGSAVQRLVLLFLAAGVAPIIEEIFFRGALYGHLRAVSNRWGLVGSIVVSAVVSSSIFAMIHPQGITFAPVLAGLAIAFCLAREWRGSLVAPMAAHAMNNATIVTLNIFLFS